MYIQYSGTHVVWAVLSVVNTHTCLHRNDLPHGDVIIIIMLLYRVPLVTHLTKSTYLKYICTYAIIITIAMHCINIYSNNYYYYYYAKVVAVVPIGGLAPEDDCTLPYTNLEG